MNLLLGRVCAVISSFTCVVCNRSVQTRVLLLGAETRTVGLHLPMRSHEITNFDCKRSGTRGIVRVAFGLVTITDTDMRRDVISASRGGRGHQPYAQMHDLENGGEYSFLLPSPRKRTGFGLACKSKVRRAYAIWQRKLGRLRFSVV